MDSEAKIQIIRLHKTWADRYMVFWQVLTLLVFFGAYLVLSESNAEPAASTGALVLLATIVLIAAIWQAVGLAVARVHLILKGVNLENQTKPR
jgi:hypothetical protein